MAKVTTFNWDRIDDKALANAKRRARQLMGPGMGFDEHHALIQTMKEFPHVNPSHLKEILYDD